MICQEVMELMQRDLDQDLNDQEMEAMHEHMQQCPQCSAMFDRLKQLNAELISLPKVAPAYSLVDRILPELDHIDQGNISDSSENSHKESRLRWFQTGPFKAITGTVAAGFLIFFFAYGGVFNTMNSTQNADDSANSAGTYSNSDSFESESMGKATMNVTTSSNSENNQLQDKTLDKRIADEPPREIDQDLPELTSENDSFNMLGIGPEVPRMSAHNDDPFINDSQPEVFMSPNGEYVAVVLSDEVTIQVAIYSGTDELNASPAFESQEIMNVRWSDDSQYLEFDVALQDTVTSHKLHVQ